MRVRPDGSGSAKSGAGNGSYNHVAAGGDAALRVPLPRLGAGCDAGRVAKGSVLTVPPFDNPDAAAHAARR